jgi:putative (di)nucleoside polyphosphate hydrolase
MSDWIDTEGYRANVGIVLMRDTGEVFLGRRTGGRGWQFPQGGVRQGEPVEQTLYRELHEEIGLTREQVEVAGSTADWLRYRLPKRYVRRGRGPTCASISRTPTSRSSTAGAGQTTGNRCAK